MNPIKRRRRRIEKLSAELNSEDIARLDRRVLLRAHGDPIMCMIRERLRRLARGYGEPASMPEFECLMEAGDCITESVQWQELEIALKTRRSLDRIRGPKPTCGD
jgi:hypothetical protein